MHGGDAEGSTPEEDASSSPASSKQETHTQKGTETVGSILGIVDQRKRLSAQQRYRAWVLTVQAFARNNALIQQVAAVIDRVLAPLRAKKASFDDTFAVFLEDYEQYLAMETKARWSWEKRNRKEMALLASIPPYIGMALATVLYQVFVPCSLSFAVLAPLYLSWILYDRWYLSPVLLGMALIARWKFAPIGLTSNAWCLIWPTLV